jgi:HlyD family secretion protein
MTQSKTEAPWSARGPVLLGLIMLAVLVGGVGTWAVLTTIAGAVIAPGQIEVDQNRQVVQHPDGGVVMDILASEGESVAAGDVLMRLDGTLMQSELAIVENQFYELLARRGRLEAERDDAQKIAFMQEALSRAETDAQVAAKLSGQVSLFEARRETLSQQIEQLSKRRSQFSNQIDGINAQLAAIRRQLELVAEELVSQQSLLDRGLAQASRVLALQREQARLGGQIGELTASRARAESQITEAELQILQLRSTRREEAIAELRDLGVRELELAERRRRLLEQINRLELRAPVSGVVYGLQVTTPRAVVRPAEPVLYLVPQDRPLIIAARISPSDIDEVRVGQRVVLVFSAFSSRTTPELFGQVTQVSADAFSDEQTGAAYYRAEITLGDDELIKLEGQPLIPGMPVEAFLQTSPRTPLAFLVKPFTDYFNRAFRGS